MSLYKRGSVWWINITTPDGKRIQRSAETEDRKAAQEYHDKIKHESWRVAKLGDRPIYTWKDAVVRWINEMSHKRSIETDKTHLRWLDGHLGDYKLADITRDKVEQLRQAKISEGCSNGRVNRMLALVRSILRKCEREWDMLEQSPFVRMMQEPKRRVRWLTHAEAEKLITELPDHLSEMTRFALATGLRDSNITGLQWSQIDMQRRCAWIHHDQSKNGKAFAIPLNETAVAIIRRQMGNHLTHVFTFKGHPVLRCNNSAWRKALIRAGIKDFRFHDLRHTWASWHVQAGTPLHVLQELGGWQNRDMVMRYAHLSPGHLADYAENVSERFVTNQLHQQKSPTAKSL